MDDKAVRGIPWTIVTFGATKVVGVLTTIALARLLSPSDFGLFALATLATGLFSIFNGNWLGATLIVRDDLDGRARGTVLTLMLLSGVLVAGVLAALAPLAATLFREPRLEGILLVYSGILVFSGVIWFYQIVMQRELEFRKRFIAQIPRMVVFSCVGLTMGALGAGVWSLVVADFLGRLVNGVALICLAPYRVRPAFELSRARDIVRGSRGFLGQELAEFFQQNADYLSIGRILGASQLGFYSMAYRQAELPHFAIADPVATVTFPAFAQMRQQGKDISHSFLTGLRLVALLTCPIGILLSAGAQPFTEAIFGPTWLPMVGPLAVLGIWAIFRPLQVTVGRLLNSLGAAWMYGRISVVGLAPFAVGTIFAAKHGGTTGVGWVLLVYIFIVGVLLMRVVARHAGVPVRSQWRVLQPLFFASAVSWVATRATANALDPSAPILTFAATAAVCLASYAAIVRLVDPQVMRLALQQVRRSLGRAKPMAAPPGPDRSPRPSPRRRKFPHAAAVGLEWLSHRPARAPRRTGAVHRRPIGVIGMPENDPGAGVPTLSERLRRLPAVARRRWLLVAAVTVAATLVAGLLGATQAKRYEATAKLLLANGDVVQSPVPGVSPGAPDPERDTNTKVSLIKLEAVAQLVETRLGLHMPLDELTAKVDASSEVTSNIVDVKATDSSAKRAAAIANGFADEYVRFRKRVARTSLVQAADGVRAELDSLTPAERASTQGSGLSSRLRQLALDAATQTGGAEVVVRAVPPRGAAGPNLIKSALLGTIIGLLLALVIVAVLELTDHRIRDEDDPEPAFGAPILAYIPRLGRASRKAALVNGDGGQDDGYEQVAGNLVFAARHRQVGALMVTSPKMSDGKTTVALGIARALAMLGKRVIVIDGDLRRPALAPRTGVTGRQGLVRAVLENAPLQGELVPLDIASMQALGPATGEQDDHAGTEAGGWVSLLPAGPAPPSASAVLSRAELGLVMAQCRSLAEFVIIDTPPIGVVPDATLLVDAVDAALVISRVGWTPRDMLSSTLRNLEGLGVPVLGLVITGASRGSRSYYGAPRAAAEPGGEPPASPPSPSPSMGELLDEPVGESVTSMWIAEPTQTEPTQTEPTQTEPTQTEPTQTEPTQTKPTQTKPTQKKARPTQTKARPNRTKPRKRQPR